MLDPTRFVTPGETIDLSYDALDRLTRAGTKTYALPELAQAGTPQLSLAASAAPHLPRPHGRFVILIATRR